MNCHARIQVSNLRNHQLMMINIKTLIKKHHTLLLVVLVIIIFCYFRTLKVYSIWYLNLSIIFLLIFTSLLILFVLFHFISFHFIPIEKWRKMTSNFPQFHKNVKFLEYVPPQCFFLYNPFFLLFRKYKFFWYWMFILDEYLLLFCTVKSFFIILQI